MHIISYKLPHAFVAGAKIFFAPPNTYLDTS